MNDTSFDRVWRAFVIGALALFTVALLAVLFSTRAWRMELDTPLLHYAAFLMDRFHLVPYRDIFETSMPGTFAFHYALGTLFGFGDGAFRMVDWVLFASLSGVTYLFMRRFQATVALWAVVLFGLLYFAEGQMMSLQRDYLGIFPVALALLCLPDRTGSPVPLSRFVVVGGLYGVAALIKPHLVVSFPVVFGSLLAFRRQAHAKTFADAMRCGAASLLALVAPIALCLWWLASQGALAAFGDMFFRYLPLHSMINGAQEVLSREARAWYLLRETARFGGYGALVAVAALGLLHAMKSKPVVLGHLIVQQCLLLCLLAYAIYPALAGKFWPYHFMPLGYFCAVSLAICFRIEPGSSESRRPARVTLSLLLAAAAISVSVSVLLPKYIAAFTAEARAGALAHAPMGGRADAIAAWLRPRLRPGDRVQPLDWTGGAVHGLLLSEARLATRFLYDYHFYHHVTTPYIARLRRSFMDELRASHPRFVIEVLTNKPWITGLGTTHEFPALRQFLDERYAVAMDAGGYRILERKSAP
jgi:hypothetical protein